MARTDGADEHARPADGFSHVACYHREHMQLRRDVREQDFQWLRAKQNVALVSAGVQSHQELRHMRADRKTCGQTRTHQPCGGTVLVGATLLRRRRFGAGIGTGGSCTGVMTDCDSA